MTGTDLTRASSRIPSRVEQNDLGQLGNWLARSGMFKDAQGGFQAFAKLMFGRDLGLSATAAMTGVHIIEGKPEISANVQAQMVRSYIGPEGERYDYRVLELTGEVCRIEFRRRWERGGEWETLGEVTYSMQDAARAQLAGKGNWKKHPRNMLFARAMSDGVAFHCPEVTNGIRTYHEGEIDVDGAIREAQAAAPPSDDVTIDGFADRLDLVDVLADEDEAMTAPATIGLAEAIRLHELARMAGVSVRWVRMHLIGLGVENVPDSVTVDTLAMLTAEQADVFRARLNAELDTQATAGDASA